MSWFNEVTGTNDYERQSWRDNFHGGRAAGDLTGNTNARLDAERASFQGATWSGSSSQPSALELARSMGGPGNGSVTVGSGATGGGAGNSVVTQGPVVPGRPAGGKGPGSRLTISGPFTPKMDDEVTQFMVGGLTIHPSRITSDMQAIEDRWGDAEFLSPAWFASWAISGNDVWNTLDARNGGVLRTEKLAADWGGVFSQSYFDNSRAIAAMRPDADPFWEVNGSARRGGDGFVYRTGGGF